MINPFELAGFVANDNRYSTNDRVSAAFYWTTIIISIMFAFDLAFNHSSEDTKLQVVKLMVCGIMIFQYAGWHNERFIKPFRLRNEKPYHNEIPSEIPTLTLWEKFGMWVKAILVVWFLIIIAIQTINWIKPLLA